MLNDFGKISSSRTLVEDCERISVSELNKVTSNVNELEINEQLVAITETYCNYGGTRKWFLCPNCKNRIGTLYRKPLSSYFLCRVCQNLTYQLRKYHRSKNESLLKQLNKFKKI